MDEKKEGPVGGEADDKAALEAVRPELLAMPEDKLLRHNTLDVAQAVETVRGNTKDLMRVRAAVEAQFGAEAAARIDRLPLLAGAARQAEVDATHVLKGVDLGLLSKEVLSLHEERLGEAVVLARRGVFPMERVDACRPIQGYRAQWMGLKALVSLLREHMAAAQAEIKLSQETLDHSDAVASRLSDAIGERNETTLRVPALEMRLRAISMLVAVYDDVVRDVNWVRWREDDADDIAPSLWAAARRARKAARERGNDGGGDEPTPVDVDKDPDVSPSTDIVDPDPNGPFVS
jgi:hypothetical protein